MNMYTTPGVKIREIKFNQQTIAGVATAIPLFIGPVERAADANGNSLLNRTHRLTSIFEFEQLFEVPAPAAIAVDFTKTEDAAGALVGVDVSFADAATEVAARTPGGAVLLYQALRHYFDNDGGPCHVIGIDDGGTGLQDNYEAALAVAETEAEITLLVLLNTIEANPVNYGQLIGAGLESCARMKDRMVIADVPGTGGDGSVDNATVITDFRNSIPSVSSEELRYGCAYAPFLETTYGIHYDAAAVTLTDAADTLVTLAEDGTVDSQASLFGAGTTLDANAVQGDPANPGVTPGEKAVLDAVESFLDRSYVFLPPSAAMAGIFARNDRLRGPHVAPANLSVKKVIGPALTITEQQHGLMNVDAGSGKSVNAIRFFMERGTIVWGARTLDGNSGDWKFVPKRRMATYLENSIKLALLSWVFAPNTATTWVSIKAMIEGFLLNEWRAGRLAGATPEGSYDVTIGLGSTMTQQDITDGVLRILVRVALAAPAEVIELTFSQRQQDA